MVYNSLKEVFPFHKSGHIYIPLFPEQAPTSM